MKRNLFAILLCLLIGGTGNLSAQGFLDKVVKGLEKTNKVLDETDKLFGTDENSSQRSSRRSKRVTGFQIVSPHPDLEIQFKRCAASASTVVIDLVMTWYGDDAKIYLGGEGNGKNATMAYDDKGKHYTYRQIPISVGGGSWSIYGYDATLFPTDVPIKVRLEIQNVSESVQEFKRLHIYMRDMNDPITFYNVPITRRNAVSQTVPSSSDGTPTEMSELGEAVDEAFADFELKFVADSAFQLSRIQFDNLGDMPYDDPEAEAVKWTPQNWILHRKTLADLKQQPNLETKQELSKSQCKQTIWIDSSGFLIEYTYTKIDGKWYLTKSFERY